jgi:hypothetical protein
MSIMVWDAPKWRAGSSDGAKGALREQFEPATRDGSEAGGGEAHPGRRRGHGARGVAPMLAETAESLARTAGEPKGISLD